MRNHPDDDDFAAEDAEAAAEFGFAAFDAAELLAIITDRGAFEWARCASHDVQRARDILRAALVSTIMLIGSANSAEARRLERAIQGPAVAPLLAALRRGEQVPERELLTIYEAARRS